MSSDTKNLLTGSRLVEMVVVALVSSIISAGGTAYVTTRVVQEQVAYLQSSQDELKDQIRDLRRDFYRPAWPESEGSDMDITIEDFLAQLKDSLHSAARMFEGTEEDSDADFKRHIQAAAAALAERRGRTLVGEITLTADEYRYTGLPADLLYIKTSLWGTDKRVDPWEDDYPGPLPRPRVVYEDTDKVLHLMPSPTQAQINTLGASYRFYYAASYWSGEANDPITLDRPDDRELLMLRAQAEAVHEMALVGASRTGETKIRMSQSSSMTPAELRQALIAEFNRRTGVAA